jgi:hypothetical protein
MRLYFQRSRRLDGIRCDAGHLILKPRLYISGLSVQGGGHYFKLQSGSRATKNRWFSGCSHALPAGRQAKGGEINRLFRKVF